MNSNWNNCRVNFIFIQYSIVINQITDAGNVNYKDNCPRRFISVITMEFIYWIILSVAWLYCVLYLI